MIQQQVYIERPGLLNFHPVIWNWGFRPPWSRGCV